MTMKATFYSACCPQEATQELLDKIASLKLAWLVEPQRTFLTPPPCNRMSAGYQDISDYEYIGFRFG